VETLAPDRGRIRPQCRHDSAPVLPRPAIDGDSWRSAHRPAICFHDPRVGATAQRHQRDALGARVAGDRRRRAPSLEGAPVAWVSRRTPEGTTNIVVADDDVESRGVLWERVGLAVLPNGTEGWLPRSSLGGWSFVDTHLFVDRRVLTATLVQSGRVIFRAPVAVGAPGTPTPAGQFYVRDRLSGFASPMYGPLAFGTNARSPTLTDWPDGGFVGIHGTDQPNLIPGRVSHGCVRLTNAAIIKLGKLMPVGTPVTIE
jgi:L,D-transpeptidase catalytic domain